MQTHRLFSTAATILGLTCTAARADLYMELGINKRYTQTAGQTVKFDSGELNLYLRDGNIILAPCTSDPQLFFYEPHLFCPLGITGFVAWGDLYRDGLINIEEYAYQFPTQAEIIAGAKPQLPGNYRFMRLLEVEPETVADVATKPAGVIGPVLDDQNHVVFKVPYRAYTGTSLKYEFLEVTTTTNNQGKIKTKTKKIKPGANWLVTYETADRDGDGQVEDATRIVRAQVERINPATGAVIEVTTYPDPDVFPPQSPITVDMTQQFVVLRSKNPVKNPAAPLPTLSVKLTAVDIR